MAPREKKCSALHSRLLFSITSYIVHVFFCWWSVCNPLGRNDHRACARAGESRKNRLMFQIHGQRRLARRIRSTHSIICHIIYSRFFYSAVRITHTHTRIESKVIPDVAWFYALCIFPAAVVGLARLRVRAHILETKNSNIYYTIRMPCNVMPFDIYKRRHC